MTGGMRAQGGHDRWYALFLLALISAFSFMDRQLPFVMADAIKADLGLTDAQIGLVGGLGFSLFYTLFSVPLARLADRWSRKWVIIGSLAIWSVATALSGLARGFAGLFAARAGIGFAEGGCVAPSHSFIASLFEPGARATAMALFLIGSTTGVMLGYAVGGWVGAAFGWRAAFMMFGLPGLLLALLAALTLREPDRTAAAAPGGPSVMKVATRLLALPTYRNVMLAASLHAIASAALFAWLPAHLQRVQDFSQAQAGLAVGLLTGIGGSVSIFAAGFVSDRLSRRDRRWQMWLPCIGVLLGLPLYLTGLAADPPFGFVALAAGGLVCTSYAGPIFATVQDLAPPGERSVASAIVILVVGLVGGAVGPSVTGWLSDRWHPTLGADSLGAALAVMLVIGHLAGSLFFWLASRSLERDLDATGLAVRP